MNTGRISAWLGKHLPVTLLTLLVVCFFLSHASGQLASLYNTTYLGKLEDFLLRMESLSYDYRMLISTTDEIDDQVVIIDIDEKSLAEQGHFPWGRDKLAHLVSLLIDEYEAVVVGFDIVFPEPDDSSGLYVLDDLAGSTLAHNPEFLSEFSSLRNSLDYDRLFANSINNRPVLLGYYFTGEEIDADITRTGILPPPAFPAGTFAGFDLYPPVAKGYGGNLPELTNSAFSSGHFTQAPDSDGIVRRIPMLYEYNNEYYEALSLAIIRYIFAADELSFGFEGNLDVVDGSYATPERLIVGPIDIPIDNRTRVLVPYRGKRNSFPYIPATDVLRGRADKDLISGRVALVGTSALGLSDLVQTPVGINYPGVEVHANMLAGMLNQNIKRSPHYVVGIEFMVLLVIGVLMALILPRVSPLMAAMVTLVLLSVHILFNYLYFWVEQNLVVPMASGIIMILMIFLLTMSYGFFIERRGKRQMATLFGQYVPPELVDEMSDDPARYSQQAQQRELTVLFSDVRGFTTLSEGLEPEELSKLMNAYLTPMTKLIHENRGTIDKYMGDAIMAFWGAPLPDDEHARHALETALAMIERLHASRDEFEERGWPPIRIGTGINTGVMSVGDMGSEFRQAYTVLGDPVNLGSRLEGLTKGYGVEIIVSETTRAAVTDYCFRELDVVRVKGKDKPVSIYEPLGREIEISTQELAELDLHQTALELYRNRNWDAAGRSFTRLLQEFGERRIYGLYLERIANFREAPPGDGWDGVYTHTSK